MPMPFWRTTDAGTNCPGCRRALPRGDGRCTACGCASQAGPWTIDAVLAQHAWSRLYSAHDARGQQVALKELLFGSVPSPSEVDAFESEARILSSLSHSAIPRSLGHFTEGEGPALRLYLAQALVDGEDLQRRLERGPLPEREVALIVGQVLEVLVYLHEHAPVVLHRDIKPANLVISRTGRVSLVDFGIARELGGPVTHRATTVGTWGYMPLEQHGGTVDARSDLYALGATALHLLTGHPPETHLDRATMALRVPGPPEVSKEMAALLQRMVALRPADRFPNAAAAARAVTAFLAGAAQGTQVQPQSPGGGFATLLLLGVGAVAAIAATAPKRKAPKRTPPPPPTSSGGSTLVFLLALAALARFAPDVRSFVAQTATDLFAQEPGSPTALSAATATTKTGTAPDGFAGRPLSPLLETSSRLDAGAAQEGSARSAPAPANTEPLDPLSEPAASPEPSTDDDSAVLEVGQDEAIP